MSRIDRNLDRQALDDLGEVACRVVGRNRRKRDTRRGREAIDDVASLSLRRYGHAGLLPRVWRMRDNLSAYDAVYVALAEVLNATLLTCDRRLASAAGRQVRIETM